MTFSEETAAPATITNSHSSYTAEIALAVLQTYGISVGPNELLSADETGKIDIYLYPLAHVFPFQSLLEDTIQYLLLRKHHARDRRIGFFLQEEDGKWFMLLLNLSDWQQEFATALLEDLDRKGYHSVKDAKAVLADQSLVEKFRHLYAKVEALILGVHLEKPVLDKLGKLLATAYGLEMTLHTLPVEAPDHREVHLVQDALTLLRSGNVTREMSILDIFYAQQRMCQQACRVHEDHVQHYQKIMQSFTEYDQTFDARRQ